MLTRMARICSYGFEDASPNALEVMAALKTTAYIAESEGDARVETTSWPMISALSPPTRRRQPQRPHPPMSTARATLIWQWSTSSATLYVRSPTPMATMTVCLSQSTNPGNKMFNNALHADWTQYVNYSDEELGWFPVYSLITLEEDPDRHAKIVEAPTTCGLRGRRSVRRILLHLPLPTGSPREGRRGSGSGCSLLLSFPWSATTICGPAPTARTSCTLSRASATEVWCRPTVS